MMLYWGVLQKVLLDKQIGEMVNAARTDMVFLAWSKWCKTHSLTYE